MAMYESLVSAFVFLFLILFTSNCNCIDICEGIGSCRCQFSNGSVIDLITLVDPHAARARFSAVNDSNTFLYNPCTDIKVAQECGEVAFAACQINKTGSFSWGNQASSKFHTTNTTGQLFISYTNKDFTLNVSLVCTKDQKSTLTITNLTSTRAELSLSTICACADEQSCMEVKPKPKPADGMSTGSVLIIVLLVLILLYVFGGMLFLRFVRGATGTETIPNYDFWMDLPALIKDGVVFMLNGCKPEASYDRI